MFALHGYTLVSRLDRQTGQIGGGICLFALDSFAPHVVHVSDSETYERSRHMIHSDLGPLLLGVWYRPPAYGEIGSIRALSQELSLFGKNCIGRIVLGDMNVHNSAWLTFSRAQSPEGLALQQVADAWGLQECVRKPTRGSHLLDLVLADLPEIIAASVVPGVSDHCIVLCSLRLGVRKVKSAQSRRFIFSKANWSGLATALSTRWREILHNKTVDNMALFSIHLAKQFIPYMHAPTRRPTHPWIDDRCLKLLQQRNEVFGTDAFQDAQAASSKAIMEAYLAYVDRTKAKLRNTPGASKKWWKVAKDLMIQESPKSSIPPLCSSSGVWATDPVLKAELFAEVWSKKGCLPEAARIDRPEHATTVDTQMSGFLPIRTRIVAVVLKRLRADSATGPGGLLARILKHCWRHLALPIAILARAILQQGCWPRTWTLHWLFPLHKRKSKTDPEMY